MAAGSTGPGEDPVFSALLGLLLVGLHETSLEVGYRHVDAVGSDDLGVLEVFVVDHDLVGIEHELRGVAEKGLLTLELDHGLAQGSLRHVVVSW